MPETDSELKVGVLPFLCTKSGGVFNIGGGGRGYQCLVDFAEGFLWSFDPSKDPKMFQRDGVFHVVSPEAAIMVSNALRISPRQFDSQKEYEEELALSKDVLIQKGDKRTYAKKEKPYFEAIDFGPDTRTFTLEDLAKTARTLEDLPDDGQVRMIQHDQSYHSHKYGYSADGVDVSVREARVIPKNDYFNLMRIREAKLFDAMLALKPAEGSELTDQWNEDLRIKKAYSPLSQQECLIITPYLRINFPRLGTLDPHSKVPDSWTPDTRLEFDYDRFVGNSILYHQEVNIYKKSPYGVQVALNVQNLSDPKIREKALGRIDLELNVLKSPLTDAFIRNYVGRLNELHNSVCALAIESMKRKS